VETLLSAENVGKKIREEVKGKKGRSVGRYATWLNKEPYYFLKGEGLEKGHFVNGR